MHGHDSLAIGGTRLSAFPVVKEPSCTAKEELLVNFGQFVFPESIQVQDVRGEELCGHATRQVFYGFPDYCQRVDQWSIANTNPVKPPSMER